MSVIQQYAGTSGFTGQLFWARLGQADSPKYRPSEKKLWMLLEQYFLLTALPFNITQPAVSKSRPRGRYN